jgi:hypothetical protein
MKKKIENRKEKKENTPPPCWTSDDGSPFLPISLSHPRGEVEKEKKRTGPLTDITTYTQEYVYKRLSGRELTNGESSRLVIIQSGRERGLPP